MQGLRVFLWILFWSVIFTVLSAFAPQLKGFEESQKQFTRVSEVYDRKEDLMRMRCRSKEVPEEFSNMFIRVFKHEGLLEVWVQDKTNKYILFNSFSIYGMSGELGPKRQQGDYQVPEGYYNIRDFNPVSNYHLSLGINYPNESDNILSKCDKKGNNIYIHGARVSAGCIAMSDYYIEDIYMYAVKARNQGQAKIPVIIYPFKMTDENLNTYCNTTQYKPYAKLWRNMAEGYRFFENNNYLPEVGVRNDGYYSFSDARLAQAVK